MFTSRSSDARSTTYPRSSWLCGRSTDLRNAPPRDLYTVELMEFSEARPALAGGAAEVHQVAVD